MLRALVFIFFASSASSVSADSCTLEDAVCTKVGSVTVDGVVLKNVCLAYARIETCTRATPIQECNALVPTTVESDPLDSGQCRITSETCTREVAGLCDRVEREYTCLNGPADAAPAQLIDRTFSDFEERLTGNCAEVIGASCTYFSSQILQGGGTRNINEKYVTRSWWEQSHSYSCDDSGFVDSCSPYEDSPVCRQSSEPVCQSTNDDGSCAYAAYTYTCESDTSFAAQCDSEPLCADGSCEGAPEDENTDYAEASAWLNFLDDMADKNQCDADATAPVEEDGVVVEDCQENRLESGNQTPEIFGGAFKSCFRGFNDCCTANVPNACTADEKLLAEKKRAGAAHKLGWSCNWVLGICLTVNEYWCTYDSKFARVFQQQAHGQTGTQLNYPGTPHCPPLTIDDLNTLDISQMDFTSVYGDLLSQTDALVEEFIVEQLETELGSYQSDVQNTLD